MITNRTYQNETVGKAFIKAVLASSHIVFIVDGEACMFPDERG